MRDYARRKRGGYIFLMFKIQKRTLANARVYRNYLDFCFNNSVLSFDKRSRLLVRIVTVGYIGIIIIS